MNDRAIDLTLIFRPIMRTTEAKISAIAGLCTALLLLSSGDVLAQERHAPSSLLSYTKPTIEDVGYMVAGELWEAIRPMNTATENGVEDPLSNMGFLKWLTIGPDGSNWREPAGMWPNDYYITNSWRDGRRMLFPVYEADGWPGYGEENPIRANGGDQTEDDRFMFAYYSPNLDGAGDPARDYASPAEFTDVTRKHLVYEAGWPTTAGIDFQVRAHQYTLNEQNLNDFVAIEITMTNTGVVDTDGDGTPEETDHVIDGIGAFIQGLPTTAVRIGDNGDRSANLFGAGRTFGYVATPDETGAPYDQVVWYANVRPDQTEERSTPPEGERGFGINNYRFLEGYTDVWNSMTFLGVRQGEQAIGTAPDKSTIFGTHSIGEGAQRGWYTSTHWQPGLVGEFPSASDRTFRSATATWYEDYGKRSDGSDIQVNLAPNSNFFSGGTAGQIETFVVGDAGARPNGDFKYASEDLSREAGITQPIWEEAWNPEASAGNFYGGDGFNLEYTFGQRMFKGIGPYSLEVGESITMVAVVAAGYRFDGIDDATRAAEWAWNRGWTIDDALPAPATPDVNVESTTAGTARVRWTDVSDAGPAPDGYKIWRASQFKRTEFLDEGFRLLDNYHHQMDPGEDVGPYLDPVNPHFDAVSLFQTDIQGTYQPEGWGTYELIETIPAGEVGSFADATNGYDFVFEDEQAITGFTYWYYVSAYRNGSFTGPLGAVDAGHIETSNMNRNGRNSPNAAPGEIGMVAPWGGTYTFAELNADFPQPGTNEYNNHGAPFTVTPPAAPVDRVADLITVTPNPYKITGLNDVRNDPSSHSIDFLNLPESFTLTIVDVSGQIILQDVVEGAPDGKYTWNMFSKDGVEVASGLYIYHVSYGDGNEVTGHFAILR